MFCISLSLTSGFEAKNCLKEPSLAISLKLSLISPFASISLLVNVSSFLPAFDSAVVFSVKTGTVP
jgi:hypothetical protein